MGIPNDENPTEEQNRWWRSRSKCTLWYRAKCAAKCASNSSSNQCILRWYWWIFLVKEVRCDCDLYTTPTTITTTTTPTTTTITTTPTTTTNTTTPPTTTITTTPTTTTNTTPTTTTTITTTTCGACTDSTVNGLNCSVLSASCSIPQISQLCPVTCNSIPSCCPTTTTATTTTAGGGAGR